MSKSKVTSTAEQIASKWNRNLKGAVTYIQQGIDNMSVSPTEEAAKKADKALQNYAERVQSGAWGNSLRQVSKAQWQEVTKKKVAQRLAGGVDEAMPKRQRFDNYLVNTLNSVLPSIAAMPNTTYEDNKAKANAMMDAMHANPYKK